MSEEVQGDASVGVEKMSLQPEKPNEIMKSKIN